VIRHEQLPPYNYKLAEFNNNLYMQEDRLMEVDNETETQGT